MSALSITHYFPFPRVRILRQRISGDARKAYLEAMPNKRFRPICHICGKRADRVHSQERRWVRDLDFGPARVWIRCLYRKIICPNCHQTPSEELDLFDPYLRVTKRLARYISGLCKVMTAKEISRHLGLDWKTVKAIDLQSLEEQFGQTDYRELRILAVDEVSIRKGHRYLTVVLDYETGRVVWVEPDRKARTLKRFFSGMSREQRQMLKAVVMDMWDPSIVAVRTKVPHVKIVFDLFHVVAQFNRVIDKVRNSEYRKASKANKEVFKGAKYLLLRNRTNIRRPKDRQHLEELLRLNKVIKRKAYGFHDIRYFSLKIIQAFAN